MKRYTHFLIISLLALVFSGCEGGGTDKPNESKLILTPSKTTLTANGTDKITFTVKDGTKDVTGQAEIFLVVGNEQTKLTAAEFTTLRDGSYTFKATYSTMESSPVVITASGAAVVPEKYYRRICVMKFTGTWCSFCPTAGRQIDYISSKDPGRIIQMALHGGQNDEPMMIPETDKLYNMFKLTGYPSAIIDFRGTAESKTMTESTMAAVNESKAKYPATCGIRISSQATSGKLNITTGVTSTTGGNYRVAVYILENDLVYKQNDNGIYNDTYVHKHVTRKLLSAAVTGDSMGAFIADVEKTKEYSVDIDSKWKLENLVVLAYVIDDATGFINNVVECKADNGSEEYKLNANN